MRTTTYKEPRLSPIYNSLTLVSVLSLVVVVVTAFWIIVTSSSAQTLPEPEEEGQKVQSIVTPTPTQELIPESSPAPSEPKESSGKCEVSSNYPEKITQWCELITKQANKNGLAPDLVAALIWQESGGNPNAYSKSGAVGLMQVMPRDGVAASFMCINGPCFTNRPSMAELYDPTFNVKYGTNFLGNLVKSKGSIRDALFRYGPSGGGYYYADKVLGIYNNYKE